MAAANPIHWTDDLFEGFFQDIVDRLNPRAASRSDTQLIETEREFTVTMRVPGVTRQQLHIEIEANELRVRGPVQSGGSPQSSCAVFERNVRLQGEIVASRAQARLRDGLLTIAVPKSLAPGRGIRIPIK